MKLNLETLRSQLQDFGLNPADWALEAIATLGELTRFEIRSYSDGHPIFEGWADKQSWLSLGITEL
jgi:hypothetical protein